MYNDTLSQGGSNWSITPGTDVYDVNGDKIGTVQRYDPQTNVFMVEKGLIFKKDLYIPTSDIQGADSNGLRLDLSKDDLKGDRFTAPPAGSQSWGTTSGTDVNP